MTPARFGSLADLMEHHAELVRQVGRDLLTPVNLDRVAEFVRRGVATGAVLEAREDRAAAQEVIGFWTARVATAAREQARVVRKSDPGGLTEPAALPDFGDTLLAEYDPATLADAVIAADRVLAAEGDRTLARRMMLRLIRLRPDEPRPAGSDNPGSAGEPRFDLVPATRSSLYDLGAGADVDRLVRALAAAGVLRVVPGESPAADQVALRGTALVTDWPTLREWADGRRAMRRRAAEYVGSRAGRSGPSHAGRAREWAIRVLAGVSEWVGRQVGRLAARSNSAASLLHRDELAEVQAYHDRNADERLLLTDSRNWEQKTGDAHRTLLGFAVLAVGVAAFLLITTALSGRQAWIESEAAKEAAEKARMAEGEARMAEGKAREERDEAKRLLLQMIEAEQRYEKLERGQATYATQTREILQDPDVARVVGEKNLPDLFKDDPPPAPRDWLWDGAGGYDPNFLSRPVPLPAVTPRYPGRPHGNPLPYLHYSLVFDPKRKMAVYTAANFDRTRRAVPRRGRDSFAPDPRLPADAQLTEAVFTQNRFDRGHLAGRQDISWGPPPAPMGRPNPAAFDQAVNVFPNLTPQYDAFNQGVWSSVEQWSRVEHNPAAERVTVFTGPVFRPDDYEYRGVRVPRSFWKVAVSDAGKAGGLVVEAVMADQYDPRTPDRPPDRPAAPGTFSYEQYRTTLAEIQRLTGLDFGPLGRGPVGN